MAVIDQKERSLGELFGDLTGDLKLLFKQEVKLAKTEMTHKVGAAGKDVAMIAGGAAVLHGGFLTLLAGIVALLAQTTELSVWMSALLVAVFALGLGALLVSNGLSALKRQSLVPEQTIATLKEDATWAKEQVTA